MTGYFSKEEGLLVAVLVGDVIRQITCGYDRTNKTFLVYEDGLWAPDNDQMDAVVVKLLGNQWRPAHTKNALGVIRHHQAVQIITREPQPQWINVTNGMVDWKTGALLDHSPDYGSTVQLPIEYDAEATCPRFEQFLTEVLPADCYTPTDDCPDGFIWEVIGYLLYSGNPLHIAFMLHGIGRNGKGALLRVLVRIIGTRNISAAGLHDLVENRFRAATLYGRLANIAGDIDARWVENTAMFKSITGCDPIQAEIKYGHAFEFTPWSVPVYSANKPFGSADSSEGWSDRWVVIPFPFHFKDEEEVDESGDGKKKDINLDAKLQTDDELRGVMARGIRALPALMKRGHLLLPESVAAAKKSFILASDSIRLWIDEHCVMDPNVFTPRTDLFRAYRFDTGLDGSKQLGNREFYNRIGQIAGVTRKKSGVEGFLGIRAKTETEKWTEQAESTNGHAKPRRCRCGATLTASDEGLCVRCSLNDRAARSGFQEGGNASA